MVHPFIKAITFTPTGRTAADLERIRLARTTPGLPHNAVEAIELLRRCEFRTFTRGDWAAYAGCESPDPRIAELGDMAVVVEGDSVTFMLVGSEDGTCPSAHLTLS